MTFRTFAGKVSRILHNGIGKARIFTGKVTSMIGNIKQFAGKVNRIPGVSIIVKRLQQEYPILKKAEDLFGKADKYSHLIDQGLRNLSASLPPKPPHRPPVRILPVNPRRVPMPIPAGGR